MSEKYTSSLAAKGFQKEKGEKRLKNPKRAEKLQRN